MRSRPTERQLGTLFALVAAVLFGTSGTVLARSPDSATALGVGAVRLAIGGPLLLIVARFGGARMDRLAGLRATVIGGGLGVAAFQVLYFTATTRTGVALGTVITIGSGPVFSGVIQSAISRVTPTGAWVAGTAISIAGVTTLALSGDRSAVDAVGVLAALGAGLGWASFATLSKRQIEQGLDSTLSLGAMFTAAAVIVAPVMVLEPMGWLATPRGLAVAIYLGAFTLTVAYALYGRALRVLPAPTVITLTLLEPVTASLLASIVLHERITPVGWVGIGAVLVGLVITARGATVPIDDTHLGQHADGAATFARQRARR